jgi:RNA polymerase sigma-70 factor, ECF subfamily
MRVEGCRDVSILTALRAGEPHAARALWTRFQPLVSRVLGHMVGPGPHNEDLAQDTFFTVFRRIHMLRDPIALRPFIVSVAVYTAWREIRKRRRHRRLIRDLIGGSSDELVVTTDFDSREGLLRLATILARLRPRERSAFSLRFIEGKDLGDIASALGVSRATVKRRLARARNRMALAAGRDPALQPYLQPHRLPGTHPGADHRDDR